MLVPTDGRNSAGVHVILFFGWIFLHMLFAYWRFDVFLRGKYASDVAFPPHAFAYWRGWRHYPLRQHELPLGFRAPPIFVVFSTIPNFGLHLFSPLSLCGLWFLGFASGPSLFPAIGPLAYQIRYPTTTNLASCRFVSGHGFGETFTQIEPTP